MGFEDFWVNALWSLVPTIGVGVLFGMIMRAIVRADRSERDAYARIEAHERRQHEES